MTPYSRFLHLRRSSEENGEEDSTSCDISVDRRPTIRKYTVRERKRLWRKKRVHAKPSRIQQLRTFLQINKSSTIILLLILSSLLFVKWWDAQSSIYFSLKPAANLLQRLGTIHWSFQFSVEFHDTSRGPSERMGFRTVAQPEPSRPTTEYYQWRHSIRSVVRLFRVPSVSTNV